MLWSCENMQLVCLKWLKVCTTMSGLIVCWLLSWLSRVLVQMRGTTEFSNDLKRIEKEIRGDACMVGGSRQPRVNIGGRFKPDYTVDWCSYRLVGAYRCCVHQYKVVWCLQVLCTPIQGGLVLTCAVYTNTRWSGDYRCCVHQYKVVWCLQMLCTPVHHWGHPTTTVIIM